MTVTVMDAQGATASDTFVATVTPMTGPQPFGSVSVSLPNSMLPDVSLLQVGQEFDVGFMDIRQTSPLTGPPTFERGVKVNVNNAAALAGVTLKLYAEVGTGIGKQSVLVGTGSLSGNEVTYWVNDYLNSDGVTAFRFTAMKSASTPAGEWELDLVPHGILVVNQDGTQLPEANVVYVGNPLFLGPRVRNQPV